VAGSTYSVSEVRHVEAEEANILVPKGEEAEAGENSESHPGSTCTRDREGGQTMKRDRIEQARHRLAEALVAGEDTGAYREALARLEADLERSAASEQSKVAKAQSDHEQMVAERSAEIASEVRAAIEATIARFPIPPRPSL